MSHLYNYCLQLAVLIDLIIRDRLRNNWSNTFGNPFLYDSLANKVGI